MKKEKIKIDKAIIVEGKYDKIKLESFVDAVILQTDGFRIFKDQEKRELIRTLARKQGILVITDSDAAGFKIRNFLKSIAKDGQVTHLYIPQIAGKERRKATASKEGTLGVEGIDVAVLKQLLEQQGILYDEASGEKAITKAVFYRDGYIGQANSAVRRKLLLEHLGLPSYMNTNSLLSVINFLMTEQQYNAFTQSLRQ